LLYVTCYTLHEKVNIKITYDWLLEYLETDADPYELQKYLSLCGPSIETVEKIENDFIFDIEITSNRIDMASVYGIAREAQAILPQFGKKAILKKRSFPKPKLPEHGLPIEIVDPENLSNRVLGVVMDNITIGESPDYIKRRLYHAGIRTLNNIVDITNYVMLDVGHPAHVFDYDRIQSKKLIFRTSKKNETITSLEDKTYKLSGGDCVIDDGTGTLIDLPGIIGTSNSVVVDSTKRILFFLDNNNPVQMRRSSMSLGIRTLAATYNEKGPDPELAYTALLYGIQLYQENTGAHIASKIHDLYPIKRITKDIKVYLKDIHRVMGITIDEKQIISILKHLGFGVMRHEDKELAYPDGLYFNITVPTYRTCDVSIKEDIIEEVARVYGYHNLPNVISPLAFVKQPKELEKLYTVQYKTKYFLKHIGLHEFLNYSMLSADLLTDLDYNLSKHLKITNTISSEIEYMRTSLLPSLIKNMKDNIGKKETLRFFEIAKVYNKNNNSLPQETYNLAIAVNTNFSDLKGIIEALLHELHIKNTSIEQGSHALMHNTASVKINKQRVGSIGILKRNYQHIIGLSEEIYIAEFNFEKLIEYFSLLYQFSPPTQYAVVKLDLTFQKSIPYQQIEDFAYKSSPLLKRVEYLSSFGNNISLRFYFSSHEKNITEKEAMVQLTNIRNKISS